ncbi:hypothetical protein F7725_023113 [Dissostichus mawsoni]|uniref:Troponin I n=1 Tax=Dissostichus mawsoni TaxID=36200 RepID=A0A7J5Z409_DISMA|nr:hypothetical protein F7725_023113 [Dissostichus mawsoni]
MHLKSKLLKKAASMLVAEIEQKKQEKERVVKDCFPPLNLPGLSVQELQDLCKELHRKIDVVDEVRYDTEVKVVKNETEVQSLKEKIFGLKGTKRPNLKRVKKTTDDMLGACSDSSKLMKPDFKANLKTVKKEEEKKEEVTDWRKNVEAMSGMDGRKKIKKSKISASRRLALKTKLLKMAAGMLEKEKEEKKQAREATLAERVPPLQLSGLSALCKDLHQKIDVVDEERYDVDAKVVKNTKEVEHLSMNIIELKGNMKRPALKRVKISADAMLGALLGAKVKESVDFKANLKTVKKEDEKKQKSKISSSRRLGLKIRLLTVAAQMLQDETEQKVKEKEAALAERVPPLSMSGLSLQELQDFCRDLHHKIDVVDEEWYDISLKVSKNEKEIDNMKLKITEIQSKFKKPTLRRVKISAEAMLSVLLGSKHKETIDFKASLKTVKKEEEKKEEVTDWRKNVDAMSEKDAFEYLSPAKKPKPKISASRRLFLKTKLLKKAMTLLENDIQMKKEERERVLSERVPQLQLSGLSLEDLQNFCKELHQKIDVVDEERYDVNSKVSKCSIEIQDLSQKIFELKGKMKRPALKRVRVSADAMLGALLGSRVKESVDFKAALKTVKKEEEKKEEVTDWRKNVDAMSGMDGRKKMFNAGQ